TEYSFFSSWAWYFFERRTVFFRTGCVKRRSTRTMTVLSCLSLTTVPCSIRFGISISSLHLFGRALLRGDGLDPCDVAAHFAHAAGILQLARGPLEAQVELFLLELHQLVGELVWRHRARVTGFHVSTPRCAVRSAS